MIRVFSTFFGAGLLPIAPGTWGSLVALPLGFLLHYGGGFPFLLAATIIIFALGLWATDKATAGKEDHDPSEIVIDEVVGQWIALMPLSFGLWHQGFEPSVFPWPGWVGAFVLFRVFDVWKPWPVSWADNMHTPLGVMLDDVLAGIMAAIVVTLAAVVWHGFILL